MSPTRYVTYQWITRGIIRTLGTVGFVLGAGMVLGGPERFSSPGFATARLVPGGVYTWGFTLAFAGAVVLAGVLWRWRRNIVIVGLALQFMWFLFFAIGLTITTITSPQGAVTGPVAYGGLALLCMIAAVGGRELEK